MHQTCTPPATCPASTRHTLTTGELAAVFELAPRTIQHLFDAGEIAGYRIQLPRNERRVPIPAALDFARRTGLPTDRLARLAADRGVTLPWLPVGLVITPDPHAAAADYPFADVRVEADLLLAGLTLARRPFDWLIVDCLVGRNTALALAAHLRGGGPHRVLLGVVTAEDDPAGPWQAHFDQAWQRPVDWARCAAALGSHRAAVVARPATVARLEAARPRPTPAPGDRNGRKHRRKR